VLLTVAGPGALAESRLPCAGLERGPVRSVARVIDAETVELDDGVELRLIGALAPRAADAHAEAGTWPPEIAAREELRALLLGKSVELAYGEERTDRYGRTQAHVFLVEGQGRRWVQSHLLEQGLARAYTAKGNRACAAELLAAERTARETRRGLWADGAYQIRQADDPAVLLHYRTTFQIIEGRVRRVRRSAGGFQLVFAGARREAAFRVLVKRADSSLLGAYAERPYALQGRLVRVRGWVDGVEAPFIDVSSAGEIEILENTRASAGPRAPSIERPATIDVAR
jgi:endonuclease YncB( thermonuclease family)